MLYYLLELHDTKTSYEPLSNATELYYLLELHDTKTYWEKDTKDGGLYYLLELHDTKTDAGMTSDELTLYYLLELHDTKTSNSCDFVSFLIEIDNSKDILNDKNRFCLFLIYIKYY